MPQKILDGHQIRIGIQELRRHRMAEMVTGDFQPRLARIVFHPFLDSPNGDRLPATDPFVDQKDFLFLRGRSSFQVIPERPFRIAADIDDPVLVPFSLADQDSSLGKIQVLETQVRHFFHPQAAPQHQHEYGAVPKAFESLEESGHFFLLQVPRERPGQAQGGALLDRVGPRSSFLLA